MHPQKPLLHWFEQHCDAAKHPAVPSGEHGGAHMPFPQWLEQHSASLVHMVPIIAQLAGAHVFMTQLPVQQSVGKKHCWALARHPNGPQTPKLH
jgi:hypothetical protein